MSNSNRKVRIGQVVSDKMDKTVVVTVEWRQTHRKYGKPIKRITRFKAHDENNQCKIGDTVRIEESRPLSRDKRWRIREIISSREIADLQPEEIDQTLIKEQITASVVQEEPIGEVGAEVEEAKPPEEEQAEEPLEQMAEMGSPEDTVEEKTVEEGIETEPVEEKAPTIAEAEAESPEEQPDESVGQETVAETEPVEKEAPTIAEAKVESPEEQPDEPVDQKVVAETEPVEEEAVQPEEVIEEETQTEDTEAKAKAKRKGRTSRKVEEPKNGPEEEHAEPSEENREP